MPKRRYLILFTAGLLVALSQNDLAHPADYTHSASEEVTQNQKTSDELRHELAQLKSELSKERKLRKELQEQLNALTELEENINERETQDNNKQTQ